MNRKSGWVTIVMVTLLVGISHEFATAQSRNSIVGAVYTNTRQPLENLRVELLDEVDGLISSTRTDGGGRYGFYNLTSGTFQVRVLTVGTEFQSRTERVTILGALLGGRSSTSEQLDIILIPKNNSGGNAPGAVFVQDVPKNARRLYEQATKDLTEDKEKDKGIAGLQQALEVFPDYYAALDLLGQEYVKRENYTAARDVSSRAVKVNPRSYSSWYTLGYAQYKLRTLGESAQALEKAASLNSAFANTYLLLGTVLRIQQKWEAAEKNIKQAKSLSKKPIPEIHWQLALLYNQTQRYQEAADELDTFLKIQPDSRDAEQIRKLIIQLRQKK